MNSHPGGAAQTRRMLALSELPPGSRVLDLGAGAGESLDLLRQEGYEAEGLDLAPRAEAVRQGNFLRAPWPDGSADAVLSQCSFFVGGDVPGALREAHRLLKHGGLLLWSDVFFDPPVPQLTGAGFQLCYAEDQTALWREYYLEALWREDVPCRDLPRGKCSYWLLIGRKD